MWNITIKGKFEDEAQLIQGKELPENAVPFQEGENIRAAFALGFWLSLPIMLPMIVLSIIRCAQIDKQLVFNAGFVFAVVITSLLGLALTYLHEFIHAAFYPKEAEKTIWKDLKQGAYFIYCDAQVSKSRFIILCIAPAFALGIFPFIVWYIVAPFWATEWIVCIMILIWMMTFMAMGDYANIYNAVRQVPKNAKVFNYGMHSYWIE